MGKANSQKKIMDSKKALAFWMPNSKEKKSNKKKITT